MKLQMLAVPFLSLVLSSTCLADEQTATSERVPIKSLDEIQWMVCTVEGTDVLHEAMPGFGEKGEKFKMRVTTEPALNGKFYLGVGKATKDDETHEMFREIWGMNPSTGMLHRWFYDRSGAVLEGSVYKQGDDRIVHVVEGSLTPDDGPLKKLAETLKMPELNYYGEIVFRRISEKQLGVTIQAVKIGGVPFPWPNLDKENIYTIVE